MEIWIGLAIAAVLVGLGLTVYALLRLLAGLRRAEQQGQRRDGGESLLLETKLRELAASQSEIIGRFSQAIESQAKSQSELQRAVAERLEALDKRLGENLQDTAAKTAEHLQVRGKPLDVRLAFGAVAAEQRDEAEHDLHVVADPVPR